MVSLLAYPIREEPEATGMSEAEKLEEAEAVAGFEKNRNTYNSGE